VFSKVESASALSPFLAHRVKFITALHDSPSPVYTL
jgi:hypothetical protein